MRRHESTTHVLFDFFGTLVDYSPSRTEQGFGRSHDVLRGLGARLGYDEFLSTWSRVCAEFDVSSDADDHEYSMTEVATGFLRGALGREPGLAEADEFVSAYLAEWNTGVGYPPGIGELVAGLAARYRLAVVTNTHEPDLVPGHLAAMGLTSLFDAVVTSVEVGWRKPHPKIYRAALDRLGVGPSSAVFVGDTFRADFDGPRRAGIRAYLIDPARREPVPDDQRLSSIFELPSRLSA